MAIEEYEAAAAAMKRAVRICQDTLSGVDDGLISPDEAEGRVNNDMLALLTVLDDAFTSAPDPRDNPRELVLQARLALDEIERSVDEHPRVPAGSSVGVAVLRRLLELRLAQADEVVRLLAVVVGWEQATPALAPLKVRRQALDELDLAIGMRLKGRFLPRMVSAGLRAFGPRWAVNLAEHYLVQHFADCEYWELVEAAMDELSAWATATDLHGTPEEFQQRAVSALIEIAGHPDLTQWAVCRIPLHRLAPADRHELAELLADRYAVMPIDWVSDEHLEGTQAIEVTYLQALDRTYAGWPGRAGRS